MSQSKQNLRNYGFVSGAPHYLVISSEVNIEVFSCRVVRGLMHKLGSQLRPDVALACWYTFETTFLLVRQVVTDGRIRLGKKPTTETLADVLSQTAPGANHNANVELQKKMECLSCRSISPIKLCHDEKKSVRLPNLSLTWSRVCLDATVLLLLTTRADCVAQSRAGTDKQNVTCSPGKS